MPSSSTRNTRHEKQLHFHFKQTYHRLDQAGAHRERDFIVVEFANLLDTTKPALLSTLLPHPTEITLEVYNREIQFEAELAKKAKSVNMYDGAKCLMDVGAELYSVGREEKARSWCEWGEQLETMAWTQWDAEQRWAKFQGRA